MRRSWRGAIGRRRVTAALAGFLWAAGGLSVNPSCAEEEKVPINIVADQFHYDQKNQKTLATGHVQIKYRNVQVQADRLEVDNEKEEARLSENVTVVTQGQTFHGEEIVFDLKGAKWTFVQASGELSPSFFQPGTVVEPIYVKGEKLAGSADQIETSHGQITTCDLDPPHYSIQAEKITIIPDNKIIAKEAAIYVGHRRIAKLHTYSISIRPTGRRTSAMMPMFGQNEVEGFFLKTSFDYMATKSELGTLYVDLMEKRGVGVGAQQDYGSRTNDGSAYLYYLQDKTSGVTELDTRFRHRQKLPNAFVADLSVDSTRNNAFFGSSTGFNGDFTLSRDTETSNFALGIHEQRSGSDFGSSTNRSANVQLTQQVSATTSVNLNEDFRFFDFAPGQPADRELTSRVEVTNRGKWLDWIFRLEQREDLDGADFTGDDFNYFLSRVPEVLLQTDSFRTKRKVFGMFPSRMTLGLGQFKEYPEKTSLFRANLNMELQRYQKKLGEATTFNLAGAFQQSFYSDDTAQYVVNYRSELQHKFDQHWSSTTSYSRQAHSGFTPFRFDLSHAFGSVDSTLAYNSGNKFRLNLSSGYDLGQGLYRDAIVRLQYSPNDTYYVSMSTGYDINNSELRDVLTRLRLFWQDRLTFNVTTRYTPITHELSRVNAYLDWRLGKRWAVQSLSGYNGFTGTFDYNQFKVTRSFHDWDAYFTYDQQRREARLDVALKAFPLFDTRFGVGRSGELLDTSGGEIY
ncbi:MAG: LPS-assembly protein LptD [Armatimonadetes bacterium]|nr:LPS-assembly protein LptD [Armatimonadota bacterium]